ncbi:adhesion G-protein coupled receptor F3 [Embiotoca jacksoni]|uniref:adhesion G-protein coupled receptor F3 n=1 Tax=Embiotoca jacksoni TaxID=100190 RepID=UPI0037044F1B
MENRNRMWTCIFLSALGLNICQAAEEGNSTQMYYAKLIIDRSALENISEILKPFVNDPSLYVDNLKITTICMDKSDSKQCNCRQGHRWSDDVCQSKQMCCGSAECSFPKEETAAPCILNTTVAITGSMNLVGVKFQGCLADQNSPNYENCKKDLLEKMKEVYSTLTGFDSLTITGFRTGSIIVDFAMSIASGVNSQDLIKKSQNLSDNLEASLSLETTGVIRLHMPPNPVCYNTATSLRCLSQEKLTAQLVWQLKKPNGDFDITNGSVSTVLISESVTEVKLLRVSELWAGEYSCVDHQQSKLTTISHKASAEMDVCLLPEIHVSTQPGFPRCKTSSDILHVRVKCEVKKSREEYNVMWNEKDITKRPREDGGETYDFTADKVVLCGVQSETTNLSCTFTNRCNQTRSAEVPIHVIYFNDPFCPADKDWEETKVGSTAQLTCKNAAGQRQRKCSQSMGKGVWEEEISACVNNELNRVLQNALIADIGLGTLDRNAAQVFSGLKNVTNDSPTINSFANINAAVNVLTTLKDKLTHINEASTAEDLLDSSSNLLEKSLESSWKSLAAGNNSLAGDYLSSVERLIQLANITNRSTKKNIEVDTCNGTDDTCYNCVFNVTVSLGNSGGRLVKTAGFQHLKSYLPYNETDDIPNSIVVSTVTEKPTHIKIIIDFQLLKPRARNVPITCVFWNNSSKHWSDNGCVWVGPDNAGRCICDHLSSFAILMSKYPVDVPGLTLITYVGVSVSIVSLVISLVVELVIWRVVVKTNTLYLRHTAHVNISMCLLVADCCFVASSKPEKISVTWCQIFAVGMHFCYLSMFFWMLCLSSTLLHQAIFLFHKVSKKNYLRFSIVLGYAVPLLIVFITFVTNQSGKEGLYFSKDTCWLVYSALLKGSIHTFIIPVGMIVFINVFSMLVVIMKLLDHHQNPENTHEKDKAAAKTVVRTVILLTPIFGVTWIFGFALMLIDLTSGPVAFAVNYAFTLLNSFQGLFILLTTILGDKTIREALLNYLKKTPPASTSDSTAKSDSTWKK